MFFLVLSLSFTNLNPRPSSCPPSRCLCPSPIRRLPLHPIPPTQQELPPNWHISPRLGGSRDPLSAATHQTPTPQHHQLHTTTTMLGRALPPESMVSFVFLVVIFMLILLFCKTGEPPTTLSPMAPNGAPTPPPPHQQEAKPTTNAPPQDNENENGNEGGRHGMT